MDYTKRLKVSPANVNTCSLLTFNKVLVVVEFT